MKKIILLLVIGLFSFGLMAQTAAAPDETRNSDKTYKDGWTYAKYTGTAADTLTTGCDTMDFVFNMRVDNGAIVKKVAVGIVMDLIEGTDTLYEVTIFGEDFDGDDYTTNTVISASESAAITTDNTFDVWESTYTESHSSASHTLTYAADSSFADASGSLGASDTATWKARVATEASYTTTVTPSMSLTWRKYVVRIIYSESGGGDEVGEGLKLESMELKLFTD